MIYVLKHVSGFVLISEILEKKIQWLSCAIEKHDIWKIHYCLWKCLLRNQVTSSFIPLYNSKARKWSSSCLSETLAPLSCSKCVLKIQETDPHPAAPGRRSGPFFQTAPRLTAGVYISLHCSSLPIHLNSCGWDGVAMVTCSHIFLCAGSIWNGAQIASNIRSGTAGLCTFARIWIT